MWSTEGTGGWPPPAEYRPHPVSYVLAVVLPLLLLAVLAAPVGVWAILRARSAAEPAGAGRPQPQADVEGGPSVGDPYYPESGSSGYDALRYRISVSWDPATQTLTGTTTMVARATQPLEAFYVDLALDATRAQVGGRPAALEKQGFQDLRITPERAVADGAEFEVTIYYAGRPGHLLRNGKTPWLTTEQEWTAAGQPESSAWWFPANDHPSDPALMEVSVRVPAGLEAVSVGRLESRDTGTEPGFDTWRWVARQPMATYLNFISIGQYQLEEGMADGRPYVYAVSEQLDPETRQSTLATLRQSRAVVGLLEGLFGPYPFSELGGIVVAHELDFAGLETQTRPVYDANAISNRDFAIDLLVHELAHMWFGNQVTVREWNDIFLNEGYASWAQWGYAERATGQSANARLNATFDRVRGNREFWQVTMIDPGREQLFSTVYTRGPMALQALRNVIGDAAFLTLAREWTADPGSRTLEEWMIKAQASTTVDLVAFFQAWIFSPTAPERTAANGFRP